MDRVRTVYPEKAREFMLNELKGDHAEARGQAIYFLLNSDAPNAEVLSLAAKAVKANPEDSRLPDQAILAIQKNLRRKDAWDFMKSKQDLKVIALAAQGHRFPRTRQAAYDVMGKIAKAGIAEFTQLLGEARKTETTPNLQKQIDRLLAEASL